MGLEATVLRVLGWTAWAGHGTLASIFLGAAVGSTRLDGMADVILAAMVASLIPTFVMMGHLARNPELLETDRGLWRVLLLWGGPIAGAAYLTSQDRRISRSPLAWFLSSFLK
jgi:hypothetical protein